MPELVFYIICLIWSPFDAEIKCSAVRKEVGSVRRIKSDLCQKLTVWLDIIESDDRVDNCA